MDDKRNQPELHLLRKHGGEELMAQALRVLRTGGLLFNGVNQYASIPHNDSLYLSGDFTVMFWASLGTPYRIWTGVVDKGRDAHSDFWFLTRAEPYGVLFGIGFTDNTFFEMYFPLVNLHEWHLYCGGVEGSRMFTSMDGRSKAYSSFTKERRVGTLPITIGCRSVVVAFAAVRVSQLLVYRRALSNEEILWNRYYPDNPVRKGLVAWLHWSSIDVDSAMWYDISGFGNHATLYNKPTPAIRKALRVLPSAR
ncbi:MAG: LamG-like jellyroll fold domain-containing protein [Thermosphaera sp.]